MSCMKAKMRQKLTIKFVLISTELNRTNLLTFQTASFIVVVISLLYIRNVIAQEADKPVACV